MSIKRKLAAIMFTHIAGSTVQMFIDETVAISLINMKESEVSEIRETENFGPRYLMYRIKNNIITLIPPNFST